MALHWRLMSVRATDAYWMMPMMRVMTGELMA
jgi:hypothetical protein